MVRKKARLTSNDPLSSTDQVLAGLSNLSNNSQAQRVNNLSSKQADRLNSQVDETLGSQEVQQSTSQQVNNEQLKNEQVDKQACQQVKNLNLRKATFKIDSQVLERLERYHLELQLQLGKRNAPYKETIVELAILELLEQLESKNEKIWSRLQQQQQLRQ